MTRLIDFWIEDKRCVAIFGDSKINSEPYIVSGVNSSYDLVAAFIDQKEKFDSFINKNYVMTHISIDPKKVRWNAPLKTPRLQDCFVSGFGYNYAMINGQPVTPEKCKGVEWFYRGNGASLKVTGESLNRPAFALSDAIQAEIVRVSMIDSCGNRHYVGYTLGNDYSDPEWRKTYTNQFNLSKIRDVGIGHELVIGEPPDDIVLTCNIYRDHKVLWSKSNIAGVNYMKYPPKLLDKVINQHFLFPPSHTVEYYLCGAVIDSYKDVEFEGLRSGDIIEIISNPDGLLLRNQLVS